jgi:large subunit ribosomal protein L35
MPKQKTRKSITKRFKVTGTGKVLHRRSFRRHLNEKKSASHKRQGRKLVKINKTYGDKIKKFLGV